MEKLQSLVRKREYVLEQITSLERDIQGLASVVDIYTRKPEMGKAETPESQNVDFQFKLIVFQNHLHQLEAQIIALKELGIEAPTLQQASSVSLHRVTQNYQASFKMDLDAVFGESVKRVDQPIIHGWMKIKKMNGAEGVVPAQCIEGFTSENSLKGTAFIMRL
jgi:hypothetical protein